MDAYYLLTIYLNDFYIILVKDIFIHLIAVDGVPPSESSDDCLHLLSQSVWQDLSLSDVPQRQAVSAHLWYLQRQSTYSKVLWELQT